MTRRKSGWSKYEKWNNTKIYLVCGTYPAIYWCVDAHRQLDTNTIDTLSSPSWHNTYRKDNNKWNEQLFILFVYCWMAGIRFFNLSWIWNLSSYCTKWIKFCVFSVYSFVVCKTQWWIRCAPKVNGANSKHAATSNTFPCDSLYGAAHSTGTGCIVHKLNIATYGFIIETLFVMP